MTMTVDGDRRRHVRVTVNQPCKVHDPRSGKYVGGQTQDMSGGGLLVELPRLVSLKPGDEVHVGVALKRRQALLRCNEMIKAYVTRAMHTVDDRTLLGLRFEQPQAEHEQVQVQALRLAA
jgi:hypothetical protein